MNTKKNIIADINKKLMNPRTDKIWLIASILDDSDYDELNSIYNKVSVLHRGLFALPYLRRKDYDTIFKRGHFITNKSIVRYIGVVLFVLQKNQKLIQEYIELRYKYECAFLLGQYNIAYQYLSEINQSIGYSVWAAEQEVKLTRQYEGLNACAKIVDKLRQAKYKLGFYSSYFFKSSSIDYPFDNDVELFYNTLQDGQLDTELVDAVINHTCAYKADYRGNKWVYEHSQSSLIDLYNSIRDNLWYFKYEEEDEHQVSRYLSIWLQLFDDPVVRKYANVKFLLAEWNIFDRRDEILLAYYRHDYELVDNLSMGYLENYPTDFEILDKRVKSLALLEKSIDKPADDACILSKIQYYYYCLLSNPQGFHIFLNKLNTILRSLYSFQSCRYLYEKANGYSVSNLNAVHKNSYKYNIFVSTDDIKAFDSQVKQSVFLRTLPTSNYNTILSNIIVGNVIDQEFTYLLSSAQNNETDATSLQLIWTENKIPVFLKAIVASDIFGQLVANSRWNEAISFYVQAKLDDPYVELRYSKDVLFQKLELEVLDDLNIPLVISIFYTMIDYTSARRYIAYKHALKHLNVKKASEVNVSDNKFIQYFLQNVADKKVMGLHRAQFRSYDDVVNERLQICNNLYSHNSDRALLKEIAELVKDQQVRRLIHKVDESRIYVDEEGIRVHELEELSTWFDVYKATDDNVFYSDSGIGLLLDYFIKSGVLNEKSKIFTLNLGDDNIETNYKESLFRQIFMSIRDKFLLNAKYGLDFHLSTRIRHGSLINQLRMHFEQYSLVTNIGSGDCYALDTYWTDKMLSLNTNQRQSCKELFLAFTQKVDASIFRIKDEYVQIRTEKHDKKLSAAFDYSYDNIKYDISILAQQCNDIDFNDCVNRIFAFLWVHTENCIKYLHSLIDNEKKILLDELSNLNRDVIELVHGEDKLVSSLTTAITQCCTDLQRDFDIVHGWLERRNTTSFEFTMQNVIDTCTTVINNMNTKGIKIEPTNTSKSSLKGLYFNYLYDVLNNILNNVLNYQKRSQEEIKCKVLVEESCNLLHIKVVNNVLEKDIPEIKKSIETAERNCERDVASGKVSGENGTGIAKIYNVVKNILNHAENKYSNTVDENDHTVTSDIWINIDNIKL